ncbi:carbohydrate-binding protein [Photobacterium rosenbergii]|uniref:Carbohydrate-binding protein n=1 Tax=Photobacterium rosenbergii TaxID=294936 RepID=A0ABU3ZL22_9GAMM|nr:carbohydrate-binding protein [Photobacterium rosenbergii]MDV5170697.1 carbohydrate-binding protein [Photobacterium rosenbergii]
MTPKTIVSIAVALAISPSVFANQGGMQDFLDDLRDFESGINPNLSTFYAENLDNPVYTYAQVTKPGRLVRDCATGVMVSEPTTINQFFQKLGIDGIYNPATPHDPEMFRQMQFNSLNAWGFVGYQLGEAVLIDAGYYSPNTVNIDGKEYDSFYMFVPDSTWIGCKTEALAEIPGSGGNQVYVTDTNLWQGTFVGKNGINSFNDLVIPEKQELVIRDAMHFNYKIMSKILADANMTWEQALAKSWPGKDDDGQPIQVQATMSGILAAAHLRGAWGTGDLLTKDQITCDELGTCITKYVHKFGGFNTLFDVPGDSISHGSIYDEVLTAGWGNDTVILGGGSNQLLLHEQSGTTTTVTDFVLNKDLIILRGWQAEDPLANLTVTDQNGSSELQFAGQSVVLNGIAANDILANPDNVIQVSNIYTLAWNIGKQVVENFNPAVDKIEGSAGIGFKHLKAYETANSVVIGPQAEDGGIYASYELIGLTLADLTPDMFVNVTGGYDRLGYIVPLSHLNWGWNMTLEVASFDVDKTVITLPSNQPTPFSALKLTQEGANVVITLLEPYAKGDKKKIVLHNTDVTLLSDANFSGFSGSYSEATIDIPVMFDIQVAVNGTGGTISPAPDANGLLQAKGGTDFTVNFIPDSGYKVKEIVVDGVTYPAASSYTFTSVNSAHSLGVSFEAGVSCPVAWDSSAVYVAGDQVTYNGTVYEAKWWTSGNQPDQGGPWQAIGGC